MFLSWLYINIYIFDVYILYILCFASCLGHAQVVQQMLCDHLALLLHQLRRHSVDQVEGNREDGEGTVNTQCQPPNQLLVLPMPEVLEHQKANGQASQGAGQMRYVRDLGTLGEGGRGSAIKILCIQSIAQITRDCRERKRARDILQLVKVSQEREREREAERDRDRESFATHQR